MLATLVADGDATIAAAVTFDAFFVLVVTSFLIPLVTGLLTKVSASAPVKQIVTLILAAVSGVIVTSTQLDGTAVVSKETAMHAALALAIAIVSYLGIYRPNDANAKLAPDFGIGGTAAPNG